MIKYDLFKNIGGKHFSSRWLLFNNIVELIKKKKKKSLIILLYACYNYHNICISLYEKLGVRIHSRRHTKSCTSGFSNVPLQRHKHYYTRPLNCGVWYELYINIIWYTCAFSFLCSKQLCNGGDRRRAGYIGIKVGNEIARRVASLDEIHNILSKYILCIYISDRKIQRQRYCSQGKRVSHIARTMYNIVYYIYIHISVWYGSATMAPSALCSRIRRAIARYVEKRSIFDRGTGPQCPCNWFCIWYTYNYTTLHT